MLRAEEATGGVSGRVAAYLGFIDRDGVPAGKEGTDRDVDLYMANIYYATDNVTGYLFGPSNTSNALGPASSPETREIRENIAAHYGQTRRARVDLYTTIGPLMRGYDAIVWGAQKVLQKAGLWEEIDTDWEGISRMRSWGWRRIEGVRRAGKEGRDVDGEYSVVSKLCGLVEQGKDGWTPEISGSEVMDHMLAGMDTTSEYSISPRRILFTGTSAEFFRRYPLFSNVSPLSSCISHPSVQLSGLSRLLNSPGHHPTARTHKIFPHCPPRSPFHSRHPPRNLPLLPRHSAHSPACRRPRRQTH